MRHGVDDLELAKAVAEGSKEAACELADRLYERVRAACRYLAGRRQDWEDLAQMAMIEILKSVGTFSGEGSLEKWADTIVVRQLWWHVKKRERYAGIMTLLRLGGGSGAGSQNGGIERSIERRSVRSRVAGHLGMINYDQRTCIVMKHVFGHSIKEIARATGAPENTVKERLKLGKAKLRKAMASDRVVMEFLKL